MFAVDLKRCQHFSLLLIVRSVSEGKHTSIVAVIIGMCLLFRGRTATASGGGGSLSREVTTPFGLARGESAEG